MPSWDIQPAAVAGVLDRTAAEGSALEGQAQRAGSAVQGAAAACGSGLVAGALGELSTSLAADVGAASARTGSALDGCARAVLAYGEGDLEMAATAQESAAGAVVADMPGHGTGAVAW